MSEHRQGPVRSEAARMDVLHATARLFAERGYDQLTVEGVAAEARVGKQTIYRWWSSKSALVADCLLEGLLLPGSFIPRDTGDILVDVQSWLDEIFQVLGEPSGQSLMLSLLAAAAENGDVGRQLRASLGASSILSARFRAAVESSNLRADAPLDEIVQALVGTIIFRTLSRSEIEPHTSERLARAVLGEWVRA